VSEARFHKAPEYTAHMNLKLLNRIRALENAGASTYVLPNIRIVF